MLGVPANEVLRMPKAGDEAGTKAFWGKLGAPADKTGYDLSAVKFSDGTALDANFVTAFQETAHGLNLPAGAAAGVVQNFVKFLEGQEAAENTEKAATLVTQRQALQTNWGPNFEANMFVAKQAAQALGIDPLVVQALENNIGYDKVMEFFRNVGARIGEDKYVAGNNPAGQGVMTQGQAAARKTELMADRGWVSKYLAGDAAAQREMSALNTMIVGGDDTSWSVRR